MRFSGQMTVGGARKSAPEKALWAALVISLVAGGFCSAQELYKYRGPDGEWMYTDRPPTDGSIAEIRQLQRGTVEAEISVTHSFEGRSVELTAHNESYAPVEMVVTIRTIRGLQFPDPDQELRWVVPARSDVVLAYLDLLEGATSPLLEYQYQYLAGDPRSQHETTQAYRVPYAIRSAYPVTQAFPEIATHMTRDSQYAVDVAMPIGTDIFAARGGVVFDVAASNFRGGLDPERDGPAANVVRILHDDGTIAIYAHLNTNTIRVRPGDFVRRGQYIADSGNTGFSSGPHLHFAVVRNAGMRMESVPVTFLGANSGSVVPASGMNLMAY